MGDNYNILHTTMINLNKGNLLLNFVKFCKNYVEKTRLNKNTDIRKKTGSGFKIILLSFS